MKAMHVLASTLTALLCAAITALGWTALQGVSEVFWTYHVIPNSPLLIVFRIQPLAGLFLCLLGVSGVLSAIYGIGYHNEYRTRRYGILLDLGILLFIVAMAAVLLAADVFTFMLGWEAMSVISFLLVIYDHRKPGNLQSGLVYAIMTQIGSAFLLVAFLVLYAYTRSLNFATFAAVAHTLPPDVQSVIFLCALIGFSTKAGIMPLHVWLPRAHPIAPSHVSSLMSGVMIKTALFGFLTVVILWFGGGATWWGLTVACLGGVSAITAAALAARATGIKQILAYSSIDNMGLIFLCTGVAMIEFSMRDTPLAMLALLAALWQTWNHGLFKTALFHGAGAILYATHTDSLNRLGGLARSMPKTSIAFSILLLSWSASPPFGGFSGEWMMFTALSTAAEHHLHGPMGILDVIALLALFFTAALTAWAALRVYGIGFLGQPRTVAARDAREVPRTMRIALWMGATLTLVSGLAGAFLIARLAKALTGIAGRVAPVPSALANGPLSPVTVPTAFVLIFAATVTAWTLIRLAQGKTSTRTVPTWTCGGERTPSMQYSGNGLSQPLERAWPLLATPLATQWLYRPAYAWVLRTATRFRKIQSGNVRSYLVYLFATIVLLLIVARVGGGVR
ncbi:MAG: proton-conducting transporter membrane subunit [Firmicutes bacterium]|nr:proton-conducting transporter membrane subunit [Bacillota bacterium]